jgi:opacity protein-like surface antigen
MFVRKALITAALAAVAVGVTPGSAAADWYLTPYIGGVFGANADFEDFDDDDAVDFEDQFERRVNFGAALGWMSNGIVGFEADFSWTPNFFENTAGEGDFDFGDSNVTSLMGNVVVGAPFGGQTGPGFRPYGSAGIGLLRTQVDGGAFFDDLSRNDLGVNVGGGAHGFFTDNIGIRGDIRYFRSLQDDEADDEFDIGLADFDFWRATVGVTFRFGN